MISFVYSLKFICVCASVKKTEIKNTTKMKPQERFSILLIADGQIVSKIISSVFHDNDKEKIKICISDSS